MTTFTLGHVVSDEGILELSMSAQASVSHFLSSQRCVDTSLCVEGTSVLSTPTQGILGPSVSSQGPPESLQSTEQFQQNTPSLSYYSGSLLLHRAHSNFFICSRDARICLIFRSAFGRFLICSSVFRICVIFLGILRTMPVFTG